MQGKWKRIVIGLAISISVIVLIAVTILMTVDRQPTEKKQTEPSQQIQTEYKHSQKSQPELPDKATEESTKTDINSVTDIKVGPSDLQKQQKTIKNVIKTATTWQPAYTYWYGSTAPDFNLTDINGKYHRLSDYRDKDVIIVFWATWCGPCKIEIPHLIELRNTISPDKLAILAITNENLDLVKSFVSAAKINYTILLNQGNMPIPYSNVNSIPSSFFIDPEGRIKLATVGLISLTEIKAILRAK